MHSMPLISVIVPIYKVEEYLDRCIESIVNQTYQNLEIILVDDGSLDRCPEMCDKWAGIDSRIRVIHKINGGLSDARNAGMEAARGEFVSFIDADDWIANEMYEMLMNAIQNEHSDIAACSVEMVWENKTPNRMLTKQVNCVLDKNEAQLSLLQESELKQPVWYKLYRQEIIDDIFFEKGKYHEDVFWSYQAIGNANRVSVIDYVGYFYWQRSGSIMGERYSLKRLDAVEAKKRRQDYLEETFPELSSKGKIDLFFTCLYHGQLVLRLLTGDEKKQAFLYLKEIINSNTLKKNDFRMQKASHKCWLFFGSIWFRGTCWLRNMCRLGL